MAEAKAADDADAADRSRRARKREEREAAAVAEAKRWEGHTHTPSKANPRVCSECSFEGLEPPAGKKKPGDEESLAGGAGPGEAGPELVDLPPGSVVKRLGKA